MNRTKLTLFVAFLCFVVVGPELGMALELLGLLDLLGVELFLLCFAVPIMFLWYQLENWLRNLDPYFFIPTKKQLNEYPSLIAHAFPGYIVSLLWVASLTFVVT